jgi:hypothetical protein
MHKAGVEPVLCLPAQGNHLKGLSALAVREFLTDLGRCRVMLGTFDEDPPRMGVAGFGDTSLATFVAAGRLTGNQPKISHNLAGMSEALEGSEFGNCDHGRKELEAFETMSVSTAALSLQLGSRSIIALSQRWIRSWAALIAIK